MAERRRLQIGEHALPLGIAGAVAWLVAILIVRGMPGLFESRGRVLAVCLATIAASEVMLRLGGAILGIEPAKRVAPAAWFAAVLLVCHALGLLAWPGLHGLDETVARHANAWLTFAAACPIVLARFWAERR